MANYSKNIPIPGKSATDIYTAITRDIDKFLSKTPIGKYELNRNDESKEISFKSNMASGSLTAKEGEVKVDIALSFLATPFKGKLDEGIQKWLTKTFG